MNSNINIQKAKKIKKSNIPFIGVPNIIDTPEMNEKIPFFITKRKAVKYYQLTQFLGQTFSKNPKNKDACILLSPISLQILTTGYNGIPRGLKETSERWSKNTIWVTQALTNAIYNAARAGTILENCLAIVSSFPTLVGARALVQVGVKVLVTSYPNVNKIEEMNDYKYSLLILGEANIVVYYAYYDTSYHITKKQLKY